jgi:acetoacetyl-CoA reductase
LNGLLIWFLIPFPISARRQTDYRIMNISPAFSITTKQETRLVWNCNECSLIGFGYHIDILVNNAGITRDATFRKLSYADWDAVLRVNLDSVFNVTRPFIDGMLERGWGRIVNIASINGSKGQFGQTNYSAAKAGMHGFTKALAQEVARKGVTVNTVSPGYLDTKMVTSMSEEVVKQVIAGIPVGRLGRPEEIAALVAFIVSESAGFMTGSNVSMNGGQHMY